MDGSSTANQLPAADYEISMQNAGGKGFSLHRLKSAGLHVPPFLLISADEFDEYLSTNKLTELYQAHFFHSRLDQDQWLQRLSNAPISVDLQHKICTFVTVHSEHAFAVRSSGSLEDGHNQSFAGQYETFLNIRGAENIFAAIQQCWASLFSERVFSYTAEFSATTLPRMAVIIQVMVPAEQSGVAFSIDPTSGNDTHVVIEAVRGLGEGLVSGHIQPDRYIIDWYSKQIISNHAAHCAKAIFTSNNPPYLEERSVSDELANQSVLTSSEIAEIGILCAKVQSLYGFPVDIEWALHDKQLWLLQARPITSIQFTCTDQQWTTANFRDGGVSSHVCTPLMWSLYEFVWEQAMPNYLHSVNLLPPKIPQRWGTMFFARPYWNVGAIKQALARLPGYVEAEFDDDLGIQKNYDGRGYVAKTTLSTALRGARVLLALHRSVRKHVVSNRTFHAEQRIRLAALDAIQPDDLSSDTWPNFYRNLVREGYLQSEGTYFSLVYNNSNYTALFRDKLTKLVPDNNFPHLIGGLENISHLRQAQDLWELARKLENSEYNDIWKNSSNAELLELYRSTNAEAGMIWMREHIHRFKHHSRCELDIRVPRFDEDPTPVFESIKQMLNSPHIQSPATIAEKQKQRFVEEETRTLLSAPLLSRRRLRKALMMLRELMWLREELRDMSTHYYYHIRRFSLFLGNRWADAGRIAAADDIFFLSATHILEELEKAGSIDLPSTVERNRMYYMSFRNFKNPNEVEPPQKSKRKSIVSSNGAPTGIGCSAGYVEGIARVVKSLDDASRLQQGDILVTHFTDPGWTLKFPLLNGIVTESGGVLSHAAVIAREYGIPAILAVPNATQLISDGQRIAIDGDTGCVNLLDTH